MAHSINQADVRPRPDIEYSGCCFVFYLAAIAVVGSLLCSTILLSGGMIVRSCAGHFIARPSHLPTPSPGFFILVPHANLHHSHIPYNTLRQQRYRLIWESLGILRTYQHTLPSAARISQSISPAISISLSRETHVKHIRNCGHSSTSSSRPPTVSTPLFSSFL